MLTFIVPGSVQMYQPIKNLSGRPARFNMDELHSTVEVRRKAEPEPVSYKGGVVAYALRPRMVVKEVPASQVVNLAKLGTTVRIVAQPDECINLINEPGVATVKLMGNALTIDTPSGRFMRISLSAAGLVLHFVDGFVELYA